MKKALVILIIAFTFMLNISGVMARNVKGTDTQGGAGTATTVESCSVFGDPDDPQHESFAYYLQQIFNIIRFAAPILVILMTIIDLVKVTAEEKQDGELKKIGIKTLKRAIYAVIIFVLPTLITIVFELVGLYGTCVS